MTPIQLTTNKYCYIFPYKTILFLKFIFQKYFVKKLKLCARSDTKKESVFGLANNFSCDIIEVVKKTNIRYAEDIPL